MLSIADWIAFYQSRANPAPARYWWKFETSAGNDEPAGDNHDQMMKKLEGEVSDVLEYHVDGDEDYGTLTCGADNDAEGEAQPCTFLITPSVR